MLSRSVYNILCKLKLLKFRKIFAVFLLFLFLCADSFNSDVFAARKKGGKKGAGKSSRRSAGSSRGAKTSKKSGKSSRRSAGSSKKSTKSSRRSASSSKGAKKSGKSSRRSASSSRKSSRRSASSSSRSSRRSAFAAGVRKKKTSAGSRVITETLANTDTKETLQTYGLQPCPLGKALWQNPDEDREGVYYKLRKTACYLPENAEVNDWIKGSDIVKAPWINNDEAVVIDCESGFLKTIQNKMSVCVEESSFCPLNKQVVEKKGKTFVNSYTGKECNKPVNTKSVRLTKDQLEFAGYDIKVGKAFYLQCKEGFYTENNDIECKKCPKFYISIQGENIGEKSCIPTKDCEKEVGKGYVMSPENGECVESQDVAVKDCKKQNRKDVVKGDLKSCGDCLSGYLLNSKGVCVNKKDALREKAIAYCKENNMGYDWDKEDSLLMLLWKNSEQKVSQSFAPNNIISNYLMKFDFISAYRMNNGMVGAGQFNSSDRFNNQNLYRPAVMPPINSNRFLDATSSVKQPVVRDNLIGQPVRPPRFDLINEPLKPTKPVLDGLPNLPPRNSLERYRGEQVISPILDRRKIWEDLRVTQPVSPPKKADDKAEEPVKSTSENKPNKLSLCKKCSAGSKIDKNGRCI